LWIINENGKREPFDVRATRVLVGPGSGFHSLDEPLEGTFAGCFIVPAHLNHFITCAKAQQFRK